MDQETTIEHAHGGGHKHNVEEDEYAPTVGCEPDTDTEDDALSRLERVENAVPNDEANEELFEMAESIRDDGLYDVQVHDWFKKEKHGNEQVVVEYETPIDGKQKDTFEWPKHPSEDNRFVQTLMAALDVDDPVAAVARAESLQQPDGDSIGSTVPAKYSNGWVIKQSAASVHSDEDSDEQSIDWVQVALTLFLGPVFVAVTVLDMISGNMPKDFVPPNAVSMSLGTAFYTMIFTALILLL